MYYNLEAELARKHITKTELAKQLGITLGTLSLKLNGKATLLLPEAKKIKEILNISMPLEELFDYSENKEQEKQLLPTV